MYTGPALGETETGKSLETASKPAWEGNQPESRRGEEKSIEDKSDKQHSLMVCLKML